MVVAVPSDASRWEEAVVCPLGKAGCSLCGTMKGSTDRMAEGNIKGDSRS